MQASPVKPATEGAGSGNAAANLAYGLPGRSQGDSVLGPIEVLWFALIFVFGCIGIIRGFLKELGVTLSILVAMYIMSEWLEKRGYLDLALRLAAAYAGPFLRDVVNTPASFNMLKLFIYSLILFIVVFISYHGETLEFPGKAPGGAAGFFLNLLAGLVNGYLITGTFWHYLDVLDYPIRAFGLFEPPLTPRAQTLLQFTPIPLLQPFIIFFIFFLIIARVYR